MATSYGGRAVAQWRLDRKDVHGGYRIIRVSANYERLARLARDRESTARGGDTFAVVPHRFAGSSSYEPCGYDTAGAPIYPKNWSDFVND